MKKWTSVVLATLLVLTIATTGTRLTNATLADDGIVTNEQPLADAGLDQTVTRGTTVFLDGTGSRDPDGTVESYDWSIRTPSGNAVTPDCAECGSTRFTPAETGRYRVTLTVTDDDGTGSSDTLYVDVEPGTPPSISLDGPEQSSVGSTATYKANLTAGSADLDYVIWRTDGTTIANHTLSAGQESDTATKRFPTAGERTITATVYDTDGQASTESLSVDVRAQSGPSNPSPGMSSTIAERHSPTITGDTLLTGSKPLRGRYTVQPDASADSVSSVEWRTTAGRVGSGHTLTRTWQPGDHDLYAVVTYVDGSEGVATFGDGSTTVTADPRPNVTLGSLDRFSSITGDATGVDEYGNLDSLRVEIDGKTVTTAKPSLRDHRRLDFDSRRRLRFSHDDFEPGEQYTVAVVATDERGQTTRVSRDVVPVKQPEIVRSEFVNSPVDSYHERIDPSRYVAHHVLEIDLNGVNPDKMDVDFRSDDQFIRNISYNNGQKKRIQNDGILFVHSYWTGKKPKEYDLNVELKTNPSNQVNTWIEGSSSKFRVTPSKPELRIDVVNDGTKRYITRNHGILVDASDSFDPDGTDLKYIWMHGAEPQKPDNTTAKFGAYERAATAIEDQYDLRTERHFDFLDYYIPKIEERTVLNEDPHYPNETVRVRVETEPYYFSKQTYYDDFSLGISVSNSSAEVVEWKTVEAPNSEHNDATEDPYRYVGILEVPASELSYVEDSTITIYNTENTRKKVQTTLPKASVLFEDGNYWTDVTVQSLSYLIEKPRVRRATVDTKQRRDEYLRQGYRIETQSNETQYVLEKRVKTQDAEYEKMTRTFSNERRRNMFLASYRQWYADESFQKEVTRTRTYSRWFDSATTPSPRKWFDSSLHNGERTGATRSVKVEPAEYQIEHQYRYSYDVRRTGTKTERSCSLKFGCDERTVTYTYTVTKTNTYWAPSRFSYDHHSTGRTRRVKVDDAEYETQFEVQYKSRYTESVTRYRVARDKLVQEAKYGWEPRVTTMDYSIARKQANRGDDWRITEETVRTWVVARNEGSTEFWTPIYENESHVAKTKAVVAGNYTRQFYDSMTGEVIERTKYQSSKYTFPDANSKRAVIENITSDKKDEKWCGIKISCSQ